MPINERDLALLLDMYNHGIDILNFTRGMNFYQFEKHKMCRAAVEKYFMVIGEAAKKISKTTQDFLPHFKWEEMVGMRNLLAHDYSSTKIGKIWAASQISIPEMLKELEKIEDLKDYINPKS